MSGKELLDIPANQLLSEFGAGNPTPGSGSAAALQGLLSCSMISTVCKISSTKSVSLSKSQVDFLRDSADQIQANLKMLFQRDSDEFQKVVDYRKARENAGDRIEARKFARLANDKLEETNETIFEIADECLKLADFAFELFDGGWPAVRGDAGAGISAAMSGAMSCAYVANLNRKSLARRMSADTYKRQLVDLTDRIQVYNEKSFNRLSILNKEADDRVLELKMEE